MAHKCRCILDGDRRVPRRGGSPRERPRPAVEGPRGGEAAPRGARLAGWRLAARLSWQRAEDEQGERLPNTPGRTVVAWPDFHPVASVPIDGRRATFSVETRL